MAAIDNYHKKPEPALDKSCKDAIVICQSNSIEPRQSFV